MKFPSIISSIQKTMQDVISLASVPKWLLFSVVLLGIAAALADALSASLIILLIYTLIGHIAETPSTNGFIASLISWVVPDLNNHVMLGLWLSSLIIMNISLTFAYTIINAKVRYRVIETVRNRLNIQFFEVSYDFILRHDQGSLLNMWAAESWFIGDVYLLAGRSLINSCALAVFLLFLLIISPKLLIIAVIGAAILFIALNRLVQAARSLGRRMREEHGRVAERMLVTLQGMRALRAFAQESRYQERFESACARAREASISFERLHALVGPTVHVGYLFLLVAVVFAGGPMGVSLVATLAFAALLYRLQPYVRELRSNLLLIAQLEASVTSVMRMLDRSDKIYVRSGSTPFRGLRDEIRFEGVSFTYAGAPSPSLDLISFVVPAGCVTALVGMSGAGKTTIVNLLLGLYRPDAGSIVVDGIPLDELRRADWLSKIAAAGQDVELVEGTVRDNLRLAQPDADLCAMRGAAKTVNLLETIEHLSDGFDSWIGQQGLRLSGGQRQRLGLARALLRNPEILILDEATNALNGSLENDILTAIRRKLPGQTLVVITHRLETAISADQVICLGSGRVLEIGSPAELQARPTSNFSTLLREPNRKALYNQTAE